MRGKLFPPPFSSNHLIDCFPGFSTEKVDPVEVERKLINIPRVEIQMSVLLTDEFSLTT